jgi:hypothetical protein
MIGVSMLYIRQFLASLGLAIVLSSLSACGGGDIASSTPPTGMGAGTVTAVASLDPLVGTETYSLVYAATQIGIDQRPVTATFASNNNLNAYYASASEGLTLGTMSNLNAAGSNLVQIGRWAGGQFGGVYFSLVPASTSFALSNDQGWHYAIGKPTVNLPCSGSMTYTLANATSPTKQDGSVAPGTLNALTVVITFNGTSATTAQTNASVQVTGSLTSNGTSIALSGSSSTATLGAQRRFGMPFVPSGGGYTTGNAYGLFAGANAEELGVTYILSNGMGNQGVTGAARLTRTANNSAVCP